MNMSMDEFLKRRRPCPLVQKWPALTGMRGIAALAVVGYHAAFLRILQGDDSWFAWVAFRGWFGVDFFFVLSAYLLSGPFLEGTRPPLAKYFWRRIMRLVPPYYGTFLALALAFNTWFYFRDFFTDFLLHTAFLHGFNQDTVLTVNPVYWTLALEFQFYLLLPLLALAFRGERWKISLPVALAITLAWRAFSGETDQESFWIRNQLPGFAIHFSLGIAMRRFPAPSWAAYRVAPAALALLTLVLALQPSGFHYFPWEATALANFTLRPLVAFCFAAIIWSIGTTNILSGLAWQGLGAMSYSIYLMHIPSQWYFARFEWGTTWWALLVLPIAVSAGYYFLVEKPSLRLVAMKK